MARCFDPKFVRSVRGRTVFRYGTRELIGATRVARKTKEQPGDPSIVWHDRIVLLPAEWCHRYRKELGQHLRNGDLIECKREDWERQQREAERKAAQISKGETASTPAEEPSE